MILRITINIKKGVEVMKKTRIFSLIALTLCLVTLLSSCGADGMMKYMNPEFNETPTITTGTKKDFLSNIGNIQQHSGNLVFLRKYAENGSASDNIYNLKTDAVVATFSTPASLTTTVEFGSVSGTQYFTVITREKDIIDEETGILTTKGKVTGATLYNADGAVLASATSDPGYKKLLNDFKFGNKIFETDKNGTIVEIGDASEFFDYGDVTAASEDYLYVESDEGIAIYDKFGNPVSTYQVKAYVYSENLIGLDYGILQNGNLFVQYIVPLPADSKKYDLYIRADDTPDGIKADLVTEIVTAKNGNVKDVDVDYVISDILFGGADEDKNKIFKDNFKYNYASISKIEDKKLTNEQYVILDNKLKIKESAEDVIDGVTVNDINLIGNNRFVVRDNLGRSHFIYKNKVKKTVTWANHNEKYIWNSKTICDYDFTPLYDFGSIGYTVIFKGSTSLVVGKSTGEVTEAVLFTESGTTLNLKAANSDDVQYLGYVGGLWGVCRDVAGMFFYDYYNEMGTLVGTYENPLNSVNVVRNEDGTMLTTCGTDFYVFTCETAE